MPEIEITVTKTAAGINVSPTSAYVPRGTTDVVLVWKGGSGVEFPPDQYFQWRGSSPDHPDVERKSATELRSASYDNIGRTKWTYKINVNGDWIDPEVNNQPPSPQL